MVLKHRPTPWKDAAVAGLMLGQIFVWSGFFYMFPAMAPAWADAFGWSLPQVMGAFTAALIAMALVTPLAGRIIDEGHGAALLAGATLLGAAGLGVVGTGSGLAGFYAAWIVIGIAMGATLYEPVFAILLRARGAEARGAITAIAIFAGFASLLTFPICHWLTLHFGPSAAPLVFAALLVTVAAPALGLSARRLAQGTPAPTTAPPRAGNPGRARLSRLIVIFALPALATGLVLSQILPLLSGLGFTTGTAVALAALMGPMQVAARIMTSLIPKAATRTVLQTAMGLLGVGAAALWLGAPTGIAATVFLIAFGAGNGLVGILRPVFVREVLGAEAIGAQAGAVARPALLAVAVSPLLGAWVLTGIGAEGLLILAALSAGLALILLLRLSQTAR